MASVRRWLDWTPENPRTPQVAGGKSGKSLATTDNATFATSGTCHLAPSLESRGAAQDHAEWAGDFHLWAMADCLLRDRCFGGVGVLHIHFCEWCIAHQLVPCWRKTFDALLESEGFLVEDGLVAGLVLREDIEGATLASPARGLDDVRLSV